MKKKGFTLIEMIVVLFILTVIFSSSYIGYNSIKKMNMEVKEEAVLYAIEDLLCYGKKYSVFNKKDCQLEIQEKDNVIYMNLKASLNIIRRYEVRNCIEIYYKEQLLENRIMRIKIDDDGRIEALSLKFKGESNKKYKVSVEVATGNINLIEGW